jgi:transcriptional repressor NrdR
MLHDSEDREITTEEIGRLVMQELRELDQVAYVRFASVYRKFEDIDAFMAELKDLLNRPK